MRHLTVTCALLGAIVLFGQTAGIAQVGRTTANIPLAEIHNREILVELDSARSAKSVSAFCADKGVSYLRSLPLSYTTYQIVRVPDGADYHAVLKQLENDPQVKCAGPNVIKHVSTTLLNDPLLLNEAPEVSQALDDPYVKNNQWALHLTGALQAWDVTTGSPNVIVAVLDTGINFGQEDLVNRLWTNTGEVAGNSTDDDSNGFIDDIHGFDFEGWSTASSSGGDSNPEDPSGDFISHGTATASIIAAQGNNNLGLSGVAGGDAASNGARLMICRVGTNSNITVDAEIGAIDYAIENGARIISMSFGGYTGGAPEENAINRAWAANVLPIAAAGNIGAGNESGGDWLVDLPAGFDNCMAVGATTIFNTQSVTSSTQIIAETLAGYSKTGPEMDICAPGTHIIAAANSSNEYTATAVGSHQFTGTSAATPLVSGLAALILSAHPSYGAQQVRDILEDTSVDLGTSGADEQYGKGRIDMAVALDAGIPGVKQGDTNDDGSVNAADLTEIQNRFGARTGDGNFLARVDCNGDGVIDELDVFVVGRKFGS